MPNTTKKQTSKVLTAARTARRVRMAGAAIAGETITSIARNEALSRDWVRRELASDQRRQIITGLVYHQHDWVIELVSLAMNAIQESLQATRAVWCEGKLRDLGPDHFARLTAVKRLIELVSSGRPTPKALAKKRGTEKR